MRMGTRKTKETLAKEYAQKRGDFKTNDCWQEQFSSYFDGMLAQEKECLKVVKDLKNKYKSNLRDVLYVKLTKIINQEKAKELQLKIDVLEEIENKLASR